MRIIRSGWGEAKLLWNIMSVSKSLVPFADVGWCFAKLLTCVPGGVRIQLKFRMNSVVVFLGFFMFGRLNMIFFFNKQGDI